MAIRWRSRRADLCRSRRAELETALAVRTQLADQDAPRRLSAHVVRKGWKLDGPDRALGPHAIGRARRPARCRGRATRRGRDPRPRRRPARSTLTPADATTDSRRLDRVPSPPCDAPVRHQCARHRSISGGRAVVSLGIWAVERHAHRGSDRARRPDPRTRCVRSRRVAPGSNKRQPRCSLTVSRRTFPVRAGIAWQRGSFEARVTAIAVVESASAERSRHRT